PQDAGELQGDGQDRVDHGGQGAEDDDRLGGMPPVRPDQVGQRGRAGQVGLKVLGAEEAADEGNELEDDTGQGRDDDGLTDVAGGAAGLFGEVDRTVVAVDGEHGDGQSRHDGTEP